MGAQRVRADVVSHADAAVADRLETVPMSGIRVHRDDACPHHPGFDIVGHFFEAPGKLCDGVGADRQIAAGYRVGFRVDCQ